MDARSFVFVKVLDLIMYGIRYGGLRYAMLENVKGIGRSDLSSS